MTDVSDAQLKMQQYLYALSLIFTVNYFRIEYAFVIYPLNIAKHSLDTR